VHGSKKFLASRWSHHRFHGRGSKGIACTAAESWIPAKGPDESRNSAWLLERNPGGAVFFGSEPYLQLFTFSQDG
jgi:hypothetical protein